MLLRENQKPNRPKTKKCITEGHKKVQNQESDPPPTIRHIRVAVVLDIGILHKSPKTLFCPFWVLFALNLEN